MRKLSRSEVFDKQLKSELVRLDRKMTGQTVR